MKTSIINNLAALLTVSGLSLTAPLIMNTRAASYTVSGSTLTEDGGNYDNGGANTDSLTVNGNHSVYNGTNITSRNTASAVNYGQGKSGVWVVNGGTAILQAGTISYEGYNSALKSSGADSYVRGENLMLIGTGSFVTGYAVDSQQNSVMELFNSTIDTVAQGASASTSGTLYLRNVDIRAYVRGYAAVAPGGHIEVDGGSLYVSGTTSAQVQAFYSAQYLSVKNVTVVVNAPDSAVVGIALYNNYGAVIEIENTSMNITGTVGNTFAGTIRDGRFSASNFDLTSNDAGMIIRGNSEATFVDSNVMAVLNTLIIQDDTLTTGTDRTITVSGGSLTATQGAIIETRGATENRHATVSITDATLTGQEFLTSDKGVNLDITLDHVNGEHSGGIKLNNQSWGDTNVTVINHSTLAGDLSNSGSGALVVTLNDSVLTGASAASDSGIINLSLDSVVTRY